MKATKINKTRNPCNARRTDEAIACQALKQTPDLAQRLASVLPPLESNSATAAKFEAEKLRIRCAHLFAELVDDATEEVVFEDSASGLFFREWDDRFDCKGRRLDEQAGDWYPKPERVTYVTAPDPEAELYDELAKAYGVNGVNGACEVIGRLEGLGIDLTDYLHRNCLVTSDDLFDDNTHSAIPLNRVCDSWLPYFAELKRLLANSHVRNNGLAD